MINNFEQKALNNILWIYQYLINTYFCKLIIVEFIQEIKVRNVTKILVMITSKNFSVLINLRLLFKSMKTDALMLMKPQYMY